MDLIKLSLMLGKEYINRIWKHKGSKAESLLSEQPTVEEIEAYIASQIDLVFKHNYSNHSQVKSEITDHFIESLTNQGSALSKREFILNFEKLYESFGRGQGIRNIVYEHIKNKQIEEVELFGPFNHIDGIFIPISIGIGTNLFTTPSSGLANFYLYVSIFSLISAGSISTIQFLQIKVTGQGHTFGNEYSKDLKKTIYISAILLCTTILLFMISDNYDLRAIYTLSLFTITYYKCKRALINYLKHRKMQQIAMNITGITNDFKL